jgi:hypothetical protein
MRAAKVRCDRTPPSRLQRADQDHPFVEVSDLGDSEKLLRNKVHLRKLLEEQVNPESIRMTDFCFKLE